jgi:hypothetical protein
MVASKTMPESGRTAHPAELFNEIMSAIGKSKREIAKSLGISRWRLDMLLSVDKSADIAAWLGAAATSRAK